MQPHADLIGNIFCGSGLASSAALMFSALISFVDKHTWVPSVIFGMLSIIMGLVSLYLQWYFKRKALEAIMKSGDRRQKVIESDQL